MSSSSGKKTGFPRLWGVVKSLDSLVHGLLLEVGEELGEVRAGNGHTCQYTIPMTSDVTLEGSGVREGCCRLGIKAGSQKLVMIQVRGQIVTSDCNVGEDVLDLVVWDHVGRKPKAQGLKPKSGNDGCRTFGRRAMRGAATCDQQSKG